MSSGFPFTRFIPNHRNDDAADAALAAWSLGDRDPVLVQAVQLWLHSLDQLVLCFATECFEAAQQCDRVTTSHAFARTDIIDPRDGTLNDDGGWIDDENESSDDERVVGTILAWLLLLLLLKLMVGSSRCVRWMLCVFVHSRRCKVPLDSAEPCDSTSSKRHRHTHRGKGTQACVHHGCP